METRKIKYAQIVLLSTLSENFLQFEQPVILRMQYNHLEILLEIKKSFNH